jgi:hypothetical protein
MFSVGSLFINNSLDRKLNSDFSLEMSLRILTLITWGMTIVSIYARYIQQAVLTINNFILTVALNFVVGTVSYNTTDLSLVIARTNWS